MLIKTAKTLNYYLYLKFYIWYSFNHSFWNKPFLILQEKTQFFNFFQIFILITFWLKIRILYYTNNWIYTTNHRRIAVNYFWFVILSGIVGMVLATLIRLELAYPGVGIFAGDSLQYLSMVTAHGVIMVFFMIMPLLFGAFANFLLPTQLGVHDVAFPRLNSAAFWFLPGGLLMLCQLVCVDRRYQRMNCFNIREIQSILKKKFFVDLINNHSHTLLLDKTIIGLRFKINSINVINSNIFIFFNYGITFTTKIKKNLFIGNALPFSITNNYFNWISFFYNNNFANIFNNFLILLTNHNNFSLNTLMFFKNIYSLIFNLYLNLTTNFIFNWTFLWVYLLNTQNNFFFKNNVYTFGYLIYLHINVNFFQFFLYYIKNYYTLYILILQIKIFFFTKNIFEILLIWNTFFLNIFEYFFLIKILEIKTRILTSSININICYYYYYFKQLIFWYYLFIINILSFIFLEFFSIQIIFFKIVIFSTIPNINIQITNTTYYFNNLFFSQLNYNTYFIYIYLITYFFCNFPLYCFYMFINVFTSKHVYLYLFETYNFLINWTLPLFFNNNIFYNFFKNLFFFKNTNEHILTFPFLIKFLNIYLNKYFFYIKINFFTIFYNLNFNFFNFFNFFFIWFSKFAQILNILLFDYVNFPLFTFFYYFYNNIFNFVYISNLTNSNLWFISTYFKKNTIDFENKYANKEFAMVSRYLKFSNPIFKYDYKSGNYFPKFYKEIYPHLLSSINDITSGLKQSPWFFSNLFNDAFFNTFNNYLNSVIQINTRSTSFLYTRNTTKIANVDAFYNFFYLLYNNNDTNKKWISLNTLNQKFYKMFNTSSLQQRIYSNWRQLKFTREAWRCKLLSARHQKTMYKRYINEDHVFWSIERNAKDLLPGWAMITPFSSRTKFTAIGKTDIGLMGVLLVLNSSIISGANFLVTYRYISTLNNRKMRDARAFFTEGVLVASWMMIAANPMLAIGIIMLLSDRHWQTSFFDYSGGGDTVLFQHMFWFFGHPEVYVIMIPTFGFVNTIISYYLRKRVSARASLMYSMYTIAFLGFFVWGHHMYMVGLAHTTRMLFSTLTVMISVPAATKIMHWCVTLVNSSFTVELPLLFTFSFIFFFVSGGISGMCVAHTGMDILFHDTFYVIGHFHVMLAGSGMFGALAAFYFYFPAIFGVKFSRIYAYLHYVYFFIGQLTTVIPMFWLGYSGMPRRVLDYPASMGGWHSIVSAGHLLIVAGFIAFFIMIFDSLRQAKVAIRNTFGINRFNTRLNFYFYEISRLTFIQQKNWFLYKFIATYSIKLNNKNYANYENYETTLFSYIFIKK